MRARGVQIVEEHVGVQIVEEHVVDDLLADLDASIGVERAMGERPSTSTHVREVGLLD
jgi:hypothetical protein